MIEYTCTRCTLKLPENSFYPSSRNKRGRSPHCIECDKKLCRDYYTKNKPKMLESFRAYAHGHREQLNSYSRKYYAANNEKILSQVRQRMSEPARKQRVYAQRKKAHVELRIQILIELGGCCYCCGLSDLRFLTIDHINNDGKKDRKLKSGKQKNGYMILLEIQKAGIPKDRYRAACYNCNCARHWAKDKICPHQLGQV